MCKIGGLAIIKIDENDDRWVFIDIKGIEHEHFSLGLTDKEYYPKKEDFRENEGFLIGKRMDKEVNNLEKMQTLPLSTLPLFLLDGIVITDKDFKTKLVAQKL